MDHWAKQKYKKMPLALNVIQKKVPCSEEKSSVIWAEQLGRNKRLVLTLMTVENKQKNKIPSCNSTSLHFSVWVVLLESAEAAKSCFSPWYQAGYHLKSIINLTLRGPSINDLHIFREEGGAGGERKRSKIDKKLMMHSNKAILFR